MLQREHSAILSTSIKLLFAIKTFVGLFFEWPFYTALTDVLLVAAVESYQPVPGAAIRPNSSTFTRIRYTLSSNFTAASTV